MSSKERKVSDMFVKRAGNAKQKESAVRGDEPLTNSKGVRDGPSVQSTMDVADASSSGAQHQLHEQQARSLMMMM